MRTPITDTVKAANIKKLKKGMYAKEDKIANSIEYNAKRLASADPITYYPVITYYIDKGAIGLTMCPLYVAVWNHSVLSGGGITVESQTDYVKYINFTKVLIRADGKVYEINYNPAHRHQYWQKPGGINAGMFASESFYVVEYYAEPMTQEEFNAFYALAHAKSAIIRFSGNDFQCERELNQRDLAAYRKTYDLYQAFIS